MRFSGQDFDVGFPGGINKGVNVAGLGADGDFLNIFTDAVLQHGHLLVVEKGGEAVLARPTENIEKLL